MQAELTKSELAILKALDATSDKIAEPHDLQIVSGLTQRGFWIVLHRMEDNALLARLEGWGMHFTITFKGMQVLKAALVSA